MAVTFVGTIQDNDVPETCLQKIKSSAEMFVGSVGGEMSKQLVMA